MKELVIIIAAAVIALLVGIMIAAWKWARQMVAKHCHYKEDGWK